MSPAQSHPEMRKGDLTWHRQSLPAPQRIPIRMRRPAGAREALGFSPLVKASRADAKRIRRFTGWEVLRLLEMNLNIVRCSRLARSVLPCNVSYCLCSRGVSVEVGVYLFGVRISAPSLRGSAYVKCHVRTVCGAAAV